MKKIKYKNKPSDKLIDRYRKKIEEYLSAHQLKLSIKLMDFPVTMEFRLNGEIEEIEKLWIESIFVRVGDRQEQIEVEIDRVGIEEDINDQQIWLDACNIQEQIYSYYKMFRDLDNKESVYWDLWKKHPER
jgi:hypothetical protein